MVGSLRSRRSSKDVLRAMLSNLQHLNLSDQVLSDGPVLKAHGGFCDVFQGRYMSGGVCMCKVAIKRLRVHIQSDRDFAKQLAKEIRVWSKLGHRNVLPLLGYVVEGTYPSLVSKWMENGTLSRYMQSHPNANLLRMVLGIAEGLEYIHDEGVIHSDMKADNVLVSPDGVPCICDFGISRMIAASQSFGETSTQTGVKGSVRWMAPELLAIHSGPQAEHSMASDTWAFGMTVYELLTKQVPYSYLRRDVQVMLVILQGVPPECPRTFFSWPVYQQKLWGICVVSWNWDPALRKPMSDVVAYLQLLCRKTDEERYNSVLHNENSVSSDAFEAPATLGHRQPSILGQDDNFTVANEELRNLHIASLGQPWEENKSHVGYSRARGTGNIRRVDLQSDCQYVQTQKQPRERALSLDIVDEQNITPDFDLRRRSRPPVEGRTHPPSGPQPHATQRPAQAQAQAPQDLITKWQEGLRLPPSVTRMRTSRNAYVERDGSGLASDYLSPHNAGVAVTGGPRSSTSSNASSTIIGNHGAETSTISDSDNVPDAKNQHASTSPSAPDVPERTSPEC